MILLSLYLTAVFFIMGYSSRVGKACQVLKDIRQAVRKLHIYKEQFAFRQNTFLSGIRALIEKHHV